MQSTGRHLFHSSRSRSISPFCPKDLIKALKMGAETIDETAIGTTIAIEVHVFQPVVSFDRCRKQGVISFRL